MIGNVAARQQEIAELCRSHGVYKLDHFGSTAIGAHRPETTDVDFIVNFWDRSPGYGLRFVQLAEELESLLGTSVDLVTERSIRNPRFRQAIEIHQETVFEDRDREAAARLADSVWRTPGLNAVALRNRIIDGYDLVDDQNIWDSIQSDLRMLIAAPEHVFSSSPFER